MMSNKNIDLGLPDGVFFRFNPKLREWKIVIGIGLKDQHITVRYWSDKKTVDIHRTIEKPTEKHLKLCELRRFTLFRVLVQLKNYQNYLYNKYWLTDTINIGKLKRNKCFLTAINSNDSNSNEIVKVTRKGKKIAFRKHVSRDFISDLYLTPDEINSSTATAFEIYSYKRNNLKYEGVIIKRKENNNSFYFLSKKKKNQYKKELYMLFLNILKKLDFEKKEEVISAFTNKLSERYNQSSNNSFP